MLEKYDLSSREGSYDALREVLQEIVLLGLYEAGFFEQAAFYGGTALRILHKLPRFSEDLDFSLLETKSDFDLQAFQKPLVSTLNAFGFDVSFEIKGKSNDNTIRRQLI